MVKRYRHENSAFIDEKQSLWRGIGEYFSLILFTILVVGIFLTVISYLKAHGRFPYLVGDTDYLDRGKVAFWFDLVASGLIISVEQQFVTTGFLFNYFWRKPKLSSTILGIISSGLIFGLLNMEIAHLINFFIYFIIGCLLATIYLATHNFKISIMLGVFIALLRVILI
ncbi:CPBP family glutamic-type intramembrane protease [Bombilactobacillus thymidiniphilus]|uniref:CAAX prenyl protease 2/Lysostaphin resistance protein A-like domain-containing protein n=1 Tax=Bombilactobacillus thymidiniphilus TaxID=2923363 RepID=A0ABY4PEN5_9LACO|nr:CPBP family glutamic-type intramembrane protease [Bombilactobacillus thymidiniphilus]UQS84206.1 hypothetical protein MOO47_03385 [Bombilactobacillus thymidiniphilus]